MLVLAVANAAEPTQTGEAKSGTNAENKASGKAAAVAEKSSEKASDKNLEAKQDAKKLATKSAIGKSTSGKLSKGKAAKTEAKSASTLPKDIKKLVVEDTLVGSGKTAVKGKTIKVNYTGWLYDPAASMGRGRQVDSSVGKDPYPFKLGAGVVIKGWDEGFTDMKVGGKRKLIIPAEMAYGVSGAGTEIPSNAPLMFEVELVDVL